MQAKNSSHGHGPAQNWLGSSHTDRRRHEAGVPDLLAALSRIQREAVALAERAYEAIQHRAYDPYREFCEKRVEHSALSSVLRTRIGPKPQDASWPAMVARQDRALLTLSIQACVKFAFALSATPLMPIGARETFINELEMLRTAREQLSAVKDDQEAATLLDELETAQMILDEVVERAPALEEF